MDSLKTSITVYGFNNKSRKRSTKLFYSNLIEETAAKFVCFHAKILKSNFPKFSETSKFPNFPKLIFRFILMYKNGCNLIGFEVTVIISYMQA